MCREASFVITRNRIFWSRESDSHEDIIQEFGLKHLDTDPPGLVRVELTPPNNDFCLPISEWEFRVDQDIMPDWWNPEWGEEQVRETAIDWLGCKVLLPGQVIKEFRDKIFAVYGTVQEVLNGGTVQEVYDGGTVQEVYDGGTVQKVLGGTVQKVCDGGTVQKVLGGTVQEVCGGTVQKVCDGGTVREVWGGGTVQEVYDGGTVQNVLGGTVQKVWGGTVQNVLGGTVQNVLGGTVQKVCDGGTVIAYTHLDPSILRSKRAVLVDRSGDVVRCFVGE